MGLWGSQQPSPLVPVEWPRSWQDHHIAAKEMVPVVIAVAIWGTAWQKSTVKVFSDNMSVVCALGSGEARDPLMMHLLRCLHFFTAHYRIVVVAEHIAGRINKAADALSRNKLDTFISCSPQAPSSPSPIPQSHADPQPARLDVVQLEENVSWYLGKALAPSTVRSYASGQRRYLKFCREAQVEPSPFVEHTLCMFCAHLASEGLSHQTIKSYLSAIRHYHIVEGKGDPFIANVFPLLQYVLRGIKRSPASPSTPAYNTSSPATSQRSLVPACGDRPGLHHALGCLQYGFLWVHESRGVHSQVTI